MISTKALGVLCHLVYTGTPPTAKALREAFEGSVGGGIDLLTGALNELYDLGVVKRETIRIGKNLMQVCTLDKELAMLLLRGLGFPVPETGFGDGLSPSVEPMEYATSSAIAKPTLVSKEYANGVREEFKTVNVEVDTMSWDGLFESTATNERLEERAIAQKRKKEEYVQQKREAQDEKGKKIIKRQMVNPSTWTVSDICYEFESRLEISWDIKPWNINQLEFRKVMGTTRKKHDTDGEIELKVVDLFYSRVDYEKFENGDHLWRTFIKLFPELALQAKDMVRSEEDIDIAKAQASKTQEWLYE